MAGESWDAGFDKPLLSVRDLVKIASFWAIMIAAVAVFWHAHNQKIINELRAELEAVKR